MTDYEARQAADRWATRVLVILGALGGGLLGVLWAPRIEFYFRFFGFSPFATAPGLVIAIGSAGLGALVVSWSARRRRRARSAAIERES
ncbi:MAG TPA: hypothetical protein VGI10_17195 [Polyangiaceae bacterium]|jgi:uncharacterized membrane protein YuzA (DUF378 family)